MLKQNITPRSEIAGSKGSAVVSLHFGGRCVQGRYYLAPLSKNNHPLHIPKPGVSKGSLEGPSHRLSCAAAEAPAAPAPPELPRDHLDLERFLSWLVANGVLGIGQEDSKVALFQSEDGERGLVCEEPISRGEVILEVPLRLALTDHSGDEESNTLLYPGAPWSVRLACKLLRHVAAGDRSPWAPYIKVLPPSVPSPLETFSWEDITQLRYLPAQEALHAAEWLAADSFLAASEEARGGLGEAHFRWALSVVHSRTFANAAPAGGVGVRMLVPLVDMLNHGGDQAVEGQLGLGGGKVTATDGVRWDLLPPARSRTGGWAMAVSATRDLQQGQEVLLSYGERANDDFFLHYGFVPRANPHDDAVLWSDLEASLEWHYGALGDRQLPHEAAEALYLAALEAGRQEQFAEAQQQRAQQQRAQQQQGQQQQGQQQGGGADGGASPAAAAAAAAPADAPELPPEVARQLAQIKVVAGCKVMAGVMRAFTEVSGGDAAAAERAVAFRCAELLWSMAGGDANHGGGDAAADRSLTSLYGSALSVEELCMKPRGGDAVGEEPAATSASVGPGGLLADLAVLLADADPRVARSPPAAAAAEEVEPQGVDARYWAEQLRGYCGVLLPRFGDLLPEGPAVAAALTAAAATAGSFSAPAETKSAGGGLKSRYGLPPSTLAARPPVQGTAAAPGGPVPLGPVVRALLGGVELPLTGPQRLSAAFRCYKQMVLWDVVLGSSAEPAELAAFARRMSSGAGR